MVVEKGDGTPLVDDKAEGGTHKGCAEEGVGCLAEALLGQRSQICIRLDGCTKAQRVFLAQTTECGHAVAVAGERGKRRRVREGG